MSRTVLQNSLQLPAQFYWVLGGKCLIFGYFELHVNITLMSRCMEEDESVFLTVGRLHAFSSTYV